MTSPTIADGAILLSQPPLTSLSLASSSILPPLRDLGLDLSDRSVSSPLAGAAGSSWISPALWDAVPMAPADPILGVSEMFRRDTHPERINLGVGAYRDDDGKPIVLPSVRHAEQLISGNQYMEYLPMGGLKSFVDASVKLAYGEHHPVVTERRVAAIQTLSGTGACRVMGEFLASFPYPSHRPIYISDPTWGNHWQIAAGCGLTGRKYRYYDPNTCGLDWDGLVTDVKNAPNGSVFLMHACAHNPTGVDPTLDQWRKLSALFKEKQHFPVFDMAYQGFASGDFDRDSAALHIFLNDGHAMALGQSYAKNMGLYGQRLGCLSVVCANEDEALRVESNLKRIGRASYSNPPMHGALLASAILNDDNLRNQWKCEVKVMADRIKDMRSALRAALEGTGSKRSWKHITDQIGMFAFTGLSPEMVDELYLRHVYLLRTGRISMAGVNTKNVERLAQHIHEVSRDP